MLKIIPAESADGNSSFRLPDNIRSRMIVWWYGAIEKNRTAQTVPLVTIIVKRFNDDGTLGGWDQFNTALTHVSLMPIGSVWNEGVYVGYAQMQSETFTADGNPNIWKIVNVLGSPPNDPVIDPLDYDLRHSWSYPYFMDSLSSYNDTV